MGRKMTHPYADELREQLKQAKDRLQDATYELGCHYLVDSWDRDQKWVELHKELTTTERTCRSEVEAIRAELALS
jgi:hypothetical protein